LKYKDKTGEGGCANLFWGTKMKSNYFNRISEYSSGLQTE
jgi:hypothetical protein